MLRTMDTLLVEETHGTSNIDPEIQNKKAHKQSISGKHEASAVKITNKLRSRASQPLCQRPI